VGVGSRASAQAEPRWACAQQVKLVEASKCATWLPTHPLNGEGLCRRLNSAGTLTGTATWPCGTSGVESRHAYKDHRVKRRTAHPADPFG
jgi:hypothetical protein